MTETETKNLKTVNTKLKPILWSISRLLAQSLVMMWLWNELMVDMFQLTSITFLQAIGIKMLVRILFHTNKDMTSLLEEQAARKKIKE